MKQWEILLNAQIVMLAGQVREGLYGGRGWAVLPVTAWAHPEAYLVGGWGSSPVGLWGGSVHSLASLPNCYAVNPLTATSELYVEWQHKSFTLVAVRGLNPVGICSRRSEAEQGSPALAVCGWNHQSRNKLDFPHLRCRFQLLTTNFQGKDVACR